MTKKNFIMILGVLAFVLMMTPIALADTGMTVSVSKYEPYPASPGQTVKVWLLVQNTGDTDLKGIKVEVMQQMPFTSYNDQSVKTIDILGPHKDYLLDFNLKVDENAVEGNNNLRVSYSYGDAATQTKDLDISVQTRDSTLTVESVKMNPAEIAPGSNGTLTIRVRNDAQSAMTDISMKLQLQAVVGSTIVDLPFAPMDSTTENRIYILQPGQSTDFTYTLRAYPDAVSKVYKVPFTLSYYNSLGQAKNKTDVIGIIVNAQPDISVLLDQTDITQQQKTGTMTLKIINKGVSDIKFLNVIIGKSNDYELLSNTDKTYVGNLVSDDYQTTEYRLNVLSKENQIQVPVTLQYRDANNRYYETSYTVPLNMIDGNKLTPKKGVSGFWLLVIIVLIGGAIWYFVKKNSKKNKKGQFYQ